MLNKKISNPSRPKRLFRGTYNAGSNPAVLATINPIIQMKINKQIAESLASKVAAQIQKANAPRLSKVEEKLKNSKEYKKLVLLGKKYEEVRSECDKIRDQIESVRREFYELKALSSDETTNITCVWSNSTKIMSVEARCAVTIHDITRDIMIEAAFAESGISADEFIEKIAKKYV